MYTGFPLKHISLQVLTDGALICSWVVYFVVMHFLVLVDLLLNHILHLLLFFLFLNLVKAVTIVSNSSLLALKNCSHLHKFISTLLLICFNRNVIVDAEVIFFLMLEHLFR